MKAPAETWREASSLPALSESRSKPVIPAAKPHIILHIGGEKTGTTAIQHTLARNRKLLLSNGILFPVSPGQDNHLMMAVSAADTAQTLDLRAMLGFDAAAKADEALAAFPAALAEELAASGADRVIISNEHCSSRLKRPDEIEKVRDLLSPLAESVTIIMYLRRQDELLFSSYSTSLKSGRTTPMPIPRSADSDFFNYPRILGLWRDVFGAENIVVRIYHENWPRNRDLIADFFEALDIPIPVGQLDMPPGLPNRRLDPQIAEFLRIMNKYIRFSENGVVNPLHGLVVQALAKIPAIQASIADPADVTALLAMFEPSNEAVAREYLHQTEGPLFPPSAEAAGPELPPLDVETAVRIAAHVIGFIRRAPAPPAPAQTMPAKKP